MGSAKLGLRGKIALLLVPVLAMVLYNLVQLRDAATGDFNASCPS